MKSVKTQLLLLIILAVLPALGIIIYSNYERQRHDVAIASDQAMIMLHGLANNHESVVDISRRFLMTLAKTPALQNQNAAVCNKLFKELLKDNTQYAAIYAVDHQGQMFANALPFQNVSLKHRQYFQDAVRTKSFSVGQYTIGQVSQKPILPFAYPVINDRGQVTGVVAVSLDLNKYGRDFLSSTNFPKDSTLNMLDRNFIRLYRHPDNEKYAGKVDTQEIVNQLLGDHKEEQFTTQGVDGVHRIYAYKKFYLDDTIYPYLYMRVGIPEEQALAPAKRSFFRNVGLLAGSSVIVILIVWLLGHALIVKRVNRLVEASRQLGRGDLSARTGLDYREGELGQLARTFDEMSEKLEAKEKDHQKARADLLESEIKFESFAEQAIVGTYILQDGIFKYVNPKFAQLFGYTVSECLDNMSFEKLVYAEDLANVKEQLRKRISGEVDFVHYTFRGVKKDGRIFDVEIYGASSVHNGKKAAAGTLLDITDRKQAEETIRENEALQRHLMETMPMGLALIDPDTRIIEYANETASAMFGAPVDFIVGQRCHAFLCSAEEGACPVCDLGQTVDNSERMMICVDGRQIPVLKSVKRIRMRGREKLLECFADISELKQMEKALRESEERFKQLAEVFPETIFESDAQGRVTYANLHGLQQFGYTEDDVVAGVNIFDLVDSVDRDKVLMRISNKAKGIDKGYLDYVALKKDGTTFYAMGFTTPIMVNGGFVGLRGFIIDITERKRHEERIRHLATHDALTDLPSLRLARDRLSMAMGQARRNQTAVAVIFLDLDGFKDVNDTLGHDAGDEVLKQVAQRMLSCVRETDTVARVGGDEFLIIATGLSLPENAKLIAQKILQSVAQPIPFQGQQAVVGASIGIAIYPRDSEDMEHLIKQADEAMYRIKKSGKNGFCFYSASE